MKHCRRTIKDTLFSTYESHFLYHHSFQARRRLLLVETLGSEKMSVTIVDR